MNLIKKTLLIWLLAVLAVTCMPTSVTGQSLLRTGDLVIAEAAAPVIGGRLSWFRDGRELLEIKLYPPNEQPYCVYALDSKVYVCERGGVRIFGPTFEDVGRFGPDLGFSIVTSIAFDRNRNSYWVVAGPKILKVAPDGRLLRTFDQDIPAELWQIDLAGDQCTLYFTRIFGQVGRFDVCTGTRLPDLTTSLPVWGARNVRIVPDGTVLAAGNDSGTAPDGVLYRLDGAGQIIQTYDTPDSREWTAVAVDPSGRTFWAQASFGLYQFDLNSGQILRGPVRAQDLANAMSVVGERRAAIDPANIPTLGQWMLMLLAIVLAAAAFVRLR